MWLSIKSFGRWVGDLVFQPPADLLVRQFFNIDERLHR